MRKKVKAFLSKLTAVFTQAKLAAYNRIIKIENFLLDLVAAIVMFTLMVANDLREAYIHHQWKKNGCHGGYGEKCKDCRHCHGCFEARVNWD